MRRACVAAAAAATVGSFLISQAAEPRRTVVDNTVVSRRDPAVDIRLPPSVHYVGSDHFLLSDPQLGRNFDTCDLYAFVDSDDGRHVRSFYWVQFEAYTAAYPHLQHTYDSPRHVVIGGLDFYVDTGVASAASPAAPGSDEAHFYSVLASQGYQRDELMSVRLVHLVDATRRKELMIIYAESLRPTGYTAAELRGQGAGHARWAGIADGLIGRAVAGIIIRSAARAPSPPS